MMKSTAMEMTMIRFSMGVVCSMTICRAMAKSRTSTAELILWRLSIFRNSMPMTTVKAVERKLRRPSVSDG